MREISEADWKTLRRLHPVAVERFCKESLRDLERAAVEPSRTFHERYRDVVELIKTRDRQMAATFDDLSAREPWP